MFLDLDRRMPPVVLAAGLGCVAWLAVLGPGYRAGLWGFRAAFSTMPWLVGCGAGSCVVGLLAAWLGRDRRRRVAMALVGAGLGAVAGAFPLGMRAKARSVPPIHDVGTDPEDPPAFAAVLAARGAGSNPTDPPGPEVAAQQRAAYPDLVPIMLKGSVGEGLAAAEAVARELGWEVVAVDPAGGRLEATDTTAWWGFKDDVVVRVRATEGGVRVDARSHSRVGMSDLGKNAERLRAFFGRLRARPGP